MNAKTISVSYSGSIPETYDKYLGTLLLEPFAKSMAAKVAGLKPQRVLELACGTGIATRHLADVLPDSAMIIASDVNPAMLDYAKRSVPNADGISWEIADAHRLPYPDGVFDAVVSQFGVMFFQDRPRAFAEAYRVLKPGGTFLFNTWDDFGYNPAVSTTQELLDQIFGLDAPGFYRIPFGYHSENRIAMDLISGGFTDFRLHTERKKGYSATARSAARGLLEGTPVLAAFQFMSPLIVQGLRGELGLRLARQFGREHLEPPIQAKFAAAVKA